MSASTGKQVQSGWACRKLDYGHVDSNDDEKQVVQPLQWKHGLVNLAIVQFPTCPSRLNLFAC